MSKLNQLRDLLNIHSVDAFIVPNNDEFGNEYLPDSAKRLEFITGFTGSAGTAIIAKHKAAFFTDGRYTIQAAAEVSADDFEIYNISQKRPTEWLKENNLVAGFDPWLVSTKEGKLLSAIHKPLTSNLIDKIWHDRPAPPQSKAFVLQAEYAGKTRQQKSSLLAEKLVGDAALITSPDSVNWLLNIRGDDINHTPFCLAYALLSKDNSCTLFIDENKLTEEVKAHLAGVKIKPFSTEQILAACHNKLIQLDPARTPFALANNIVNIHEATDPCQIAKAIKNSAEIAGIKKAHEIDGVAVTKFLKWVAKENDLDELKAQKKLEDFRRDAKEYQGPSFDTISGFASNGAIVHYRSSTKTNKKFEDGSLYLVDSGGQYLGSEACGTTDITRTIAIGEPTAEMRRNFTLVLKGHIAIATAVFPKGTTGAQLDALARQYLWQDGLDYDHGTGHGVGHFLSVHEGPQGISKRYNETPLESGMVISNEPGYYKAGEYGIRIENLVLVVEKNDKFLEFTTLTKAPFDENLIEWNLLTPQETDWVKNYNKSCAI